MGTTKLKEHLLLYREPEEAVLASVSKPMLGP